MFVAVLMEQIVVAAKVTREVTLVTVNVAVENTECDEGVLPILCGWKRIGHWRGEEVQTVAFIEAQFLQSIPIHHIESEQ